MDTGDDTHNTNSAFSLSNYTSGQMARMPVNTSQVVLPGGNFRLENRSMVQSHQPQQQQHSTGISQPVRLGFTANAQQFGQPLQHQNIIDFTSGSSVQRPALQLSLSPSCWWTFKSTTILWICGRWAVCSLASFSRKSPSSTVMTIWTSWSK